MHFYFGLFVIYSAAHVCSVVQAWTVQEITVSPDDLVQMLFDTISEQQVKEDLPLVPLKQFRRIKGIYPSFVKINVHGKQEMAAARKLLAIFDNNNFVTGLITSILLEAYHYGRAPKPTETQLMLVVDVLQKFVDLNKPYKNSALFFFPLIYNETVEFWQSEALNIYTAMGTAEQKPFKLFEEFLNLLGLKNLTSTLDKILKNKEVIKHAFHLCPDIDGSVVNLVFGSLLYTLRRQFPQAFARWIKQYNMTSIFDALKKYAYRPFHKDPQTDLIDPRTYMYLRFFLDDARTAGKDLALVTTWMQNPAELKTETKKGVAVPQNVNTVDAMICANVVYGITTSVLSGLMTPDIFHDAAIAQIYHNSSALVAYQIQTNLSSRPELALLYYPSRMQFNWMVSRTVAALDTAKAQGPLPSPVMEEVHEMLLTATKGSMTKYILSEAQEDEHGDVYFDDFLGDADLTQENQPMRRAEDRIYTTAMAVNALLGTWARFNETSRKSHWKEGVPLQVKEVVGASIRWLNKYTFSGNYELWNAAFTVSSKDETTAINQYPANLFQDVNGTALPWSKSYNIITDRLAVKGYIPPTEYTAMLKEKKTPLVFHGYNTPKSFFPFWSSEPLTHSVTLLALSRYRETVD